jgi:hypothetical protein
MLVAIPPVRVCVPLAAVGWVLHDSSVSSSRWASQPHNIVRSCCWVGVSTGRQLCSMLCWAVAVRLPCTGAFCHRLSKKPPVAGHSGIAVCPSLVGGCYRHCPFSLPLLIPSHCC